MFKRALTSGVFLSALTLTFGTANAGEFVTQEKPALPGRSVPYCSSTFGCFLAGITDLPASKLIPDRVSPPPESVFAPFSAAPPAPLKLKSAQKLTIAVEPIELDRMKYLIASASETEVRLVSSDRKVRSKSIDFYVVTALDASDTGKSSRLYEAQMHILAAPDVHLLSDLTNKVVSFGLANSSSQAVARAAFAALSIPVQETPLDLDNALDGLSTGDVEAVVLLAPAPIARLAKLTTPGLHLMSWPEGVPLPVGANVSSIYPGAYPRLVQPGKVVPALGVDAVLRKNTQNGRVREDEADLAVRLRDGRDGDRKPE